MRATKDSGVEWLGEIPVDWLVKPLKRNTYIKARVGWKGLTSDEFEVESFAYLVTGRDFSSKVIDFSECYQVSQERYLDDPFIQLKQGDILITKDGTIGKVAWVNELDKPACLNSGIFVVRPKADYVAEFLSWVLESAVFKEFIRLVSSGSTIQHLYQNVFENFSFGIPPVEEQRRIADFLDRETAKIDALIAKQEQLITTLDERRQALIKRAVTEGLNPEAPLKTVESIWFKRIPSRWKAGPLKRFAEVTLGKMVSSDKPEGDALEIPYLRAASVQPQGQIDFDDSKRMSFSLRERERFGLKKNDVVVVEGGSIGRSALIAEDLENWGYQNSINRVRAMRHVTGGYLNWSLQALESSGVYSMMTNVSTIAHLTAEKLKTVPIAVPPVEEQEEICFHLESITQELDRLAETSRLTIALLQERRQSLISAAVTGKLEVGV